MSQRVHATAAVVSSGDELVLGQTLDTNSKWLSERLTSLGVRVVEHVTVGDDEASLIATLTRLSERVDVIIITGGLGPTADDLTRFALAKVINEPLVEDPRGVAHLEKIARSRGKELHPSQLVQAQRPQSATLIDNAFGTAPGIHAQILFPMGGGAGQGSPRVVDVLCLPGPPVELHAMFDGFVASQLKPPTSHAISTMALHTFGLAESEVARRLGALMNRDANPVVGTTASGGVVTCRVRYEGSAQAGEIALRDVEQRVRSVLDPFIFGVADDTLAGVVIKLLRQQRARLVVAESCTGGMLGELITTVAGSSDVFLGGWITYANEMKIAEVNVAPEILAQSGAVSEPTARAMATGALRSARLPGVSADHALAITGVAGPGGGTTAKPVGDVFIARASRAGRDRPASDINVEVRRFRFPGDRAAIRERAAKFALAMLRFHLALPQDQAAPQLLWEVQLDGRP